MHYTANNGGTAMNHYNYFNNLNGTFASAHFFADKDEKLLIIPLSEIAYHANDGTSRGVAELKPNANFLSIGIEMCLEKDGSIHAQTIKHSEDIAVELCKRYKLDPLKDIVRHYDVTSKNCPAPWVKNSASFVNFKNSVNAKLKGTSVDVVVKPSNPVVNKGMMGAAVERLQNLLVGKGYRIVVDRIFGESTEVAVKDFQKKNELTADGYVGDATWAKLQYVTPAPKPTPPTVIKLYRVRSTWADASSQIGAFSDLNSAKDLADSKSGYKVYNDDGSVAYKPVAKPATPATPPVVKPVEPVVKPVEDAHKGHHDIMGKSVVPVEKMVAFVKQRFAYATDIEEIAKQFTQVGNTYGIRGDVAFCQSIIETGWFKFDGGTAVTPDQHNYCGMGVTSKGMKGNEFATVRDGVTAQIQHIFAYASKDSIPNGEINLDPRFKYVTRGIAPHWEDLSNRWAMNANYGTHILSMYEQLVEFKYVAPKPPLEKPIEPIEEPKEEVQVEQVKSLIDDFIEKIKLLFGKK